MSPINGELHQSQANIVSQDWKHFPVFWIHITVKHPLLLVLPAHTPSLRCPCSSEWGMVARSQDLRGWCAHCHWGVIAYNGQIKIVGFLLNLLYLVFKSFSYPPIFGSIILEYIYLLSPIL
jgi:hypothetical protein